MEPNESDLSFQLLQCIKTLKNSDNGEVFQEAICSRMQAEHGVSPEVTLAELQKLCGSSKIFANEQNGATSYCIKSPNLKRSRSDTGPAQTDVPKESSHLLTKCVKQIDQSNNGQGASFDEILDWMRHNHASGELTTSTLQQSLDRELSSTRLKKNEAGLYTIAKKRGRPTGAGYTGKKSSRSGVNGVRRSLDDTPKKDSGAGKRKRIRKSQNGDFEFYGNADTSGLVNSEPICDFCLKSASCNKMGMFEELLKCKDCTAKAHPSCMSYSEILSRRARLSPWQCIDCKTCCLCLDSGSPDDLLFCDACDKGYHMFCHDPPVQTKPKNKWACNRCLSDGVTPEDLLSDDAEELANAEKMLDNPSNIKQSQIASSGDVNASTCSPSSSSPTRTSSPISSSKSLLPSLPSQWSVAQVTQYIEECGFQEEAKRFQEQEIDGKSLLLLMRQDVLCNMSLKLGPALKIYEKIRTIQKGSNAAKL